MFFKHKKKQMKVRLSNRRWSFLPLMAVLVIACCAELPPPYQIAVVHRHGARTTIVSVNRTAVCPPPLGCGTLTTEGKDMLYHLGLYLRAAYNATLQPADHYDPQQFYSRSTDFPRTLQSGAAMLRGLFAHLEGTDERVYPVLHTRSMVEAERLLVWTGVPSVVLFTDYVMPKFLTVLNEFSSHLLDNETLTRIGLETGLALECTPSSSTFSAFQCALDAQDVYNCALSAGTAPSSQYVVTASRFDDLTRVLEAYNAYSMWGYDDLEFGGSFIKSVGTLGYNLAVDIIENALAYPATQTPLRHYSGHDTTLMPLWMTLGNYSLVNPLFGEAMVFEFRDVDSVPYVAAKMGAPGQLPANHSYTFQGFPLHCTNASGVTYTSSDDLGCPVADWARFIESRGPSVANARCFANSTWLAALQCAPNSTLFAKSRPCMAFRQSCGPLACGDSYNMQSNYSCVASD